MLRRGRNGWKGMSRWLTSQTHGACNSNWDWDWSWSWGLELELGQDWDWYWSWGGAGAGIGSWGWGCEENGYSGFVCALPCVVHRPSPTLVVLSMVFRRQMHTDLALECPMCQRRMPHVFASHAPCVCIACPMCPRRMPHVPASHAPCGACPWRPGTLSR